MQPRIAIFISAITVCVIGAVSVSSRVYDTRVRRPQDRKPLVVCTTSLIADTVKKIGTSYVSVECLMGPGIDPHSYRAREKDAQLLAQADLILYHGLHLEGKMGELLAALSQTKKVAAVTRALARHNLRTSVFEGVYDPHVWHEVVLWAEVVREIGVQLCALDPENAMMYQVNMKHYLIQLKALDEYVCSQVALIPPEKRILVTAHDAFFYFGRAYDFVVVGLQGISTEVEVGIADVLQLTEFVIGHQVPAIFLESCVLPRSLQAVQSAAQAHGLHVAIVPELYADALGTVGSGCDTYCTMIKHNVDTIVQSLMSHYIKDE